MDDREGCMEMIRSIAPILLGGTEIIEKVYGVPRTTAWVSPSWTVSGPRATGSIEANCSV